MLQVRNERIRFSVFTNMIPLVLLILIYYTRFLNTNLNPLYAVLITLFWCFQSIFLKSLTNIFFNRWSKLWLIYLFLGVFMVLIGFAAANINFYISSIPVYVLPIAGYFVVNYYNRREQLLLLVLFFAIFLANVGWNYSLWLTYPDIFESLESTEESVEFAAMMNIAPTPYNAVCFFSIGLVLMVLDNCRKFLLSICGIVLICFLLFYMLVINTRATAMIILLLMLVGMFIAKKEPNRKKLNNYYITNILVLVGIGFLFVLPVLVWMANNIESERLAERLQDLIAFTSSKGDLDNVEEGSFTKRILLIQTSLRTFLDGPINMLIGIGEQANGIGVDLVKVGIGNHSEFTDVLAKHGIVGGVLFWKILSTYKRWLASLSCRRSIIKYVNVFFVIFIIYGFLNKVFQPILLIYMFFIIPISIRQLDYWIIRNRL